MIKPAAASAHLLQHRGRAVVFDSIEDMHARIDDPDLDVDADSVLVLRGCGPKGYPGMPEVANMPLPTKLLRAGRARHGPDLRRPDERDRVRHRRPARRPEAAAGGPLARLRTGDVVVLDVPDRRLDVDVAGRGARPRASPDAATAAAFAAPARGWERLYVEHVTQADTGADLDFLVGRSGSSGLARVALTRRRTARPVARYG